MPGSMTKCIVWMYYLYYTPHTDHHRIVDSCSTIVYSTLGYTVTFITRYLELFVAVLRAAMMWQVTTSDFLKFFGFIIVCIYFVLYVWYSTHITITVLLTTALHWDIHLLCTRSPHHNRAFNSCSTLGYTLAMYKYKIPWAGLRAATMWHPIFISHHKVVWIYCTQLSFSVWFSRFARASWLLMTTHQYRSYPSCSTKT